MTKIYIVVFILFLISIFLFVAAFIYVDKEGHETYYYAVKLDERDVGTIKVEKFVTEDKFLYKSSCDTPFGALVTGEKSKLILDRRYNLESYSRERFANGAIETAYMERRDNAASFVATADAKFACLKGIPIKEGTFVFEEDSPVTYIPLIENYDFRKGRFQGFNAITNFPALLPPIRRFVTLTSVRDEYVSVGSRKIKTECMFVKIRNYPQVSIWVAKSDKSLVMLDMPDRRLKIVRQSSPCALQARPYAAEGDGYLAREASFKSGNVRLAGTFTAPIKEGRHPAVLLVWGEGPQDREYQGFFTSIADYLSRHGFSVLRFDKRGIGASGGDYSSAAASDTVEDVKAALGYLAESNEVDPERIAVLGHAKGAFYAAKAAMGKEGIKAFVLMAPIESMAELPESNWNEAYLKLVSESALETKEYVVNTKGNWASVLGKRCYLKKAREELEEKPIDTIKNITTPVFILQGREDEEVFAESAFNIDKALEGAGNSQTTLLYFGYLGHFFGEIVNDGIYRMRYDLDAGVLEAIKSWLAKNLPPSGDSASSSGS